MREPDVSNEPCWTPNPDPASIVVPGVDTSASVNDQIDQIDQLITIRLQNIDANFSRIQHIISIKLLPAFKRYAEGTEHVREAAKFWKSFYEAAAQVRIPIANDTSSLYHTEDDDSEHDTSVPFEPDQDKTPADMNPHEDSFVRGAPVSSTPLVRESVNAPLSHDTQDDDSWAASIESPFERLGRQVKDLNVDEVGHSTESPSTSSAPTFSPMHGSYTGTIPPSSRPTRPQAPSEPIPQFPPSRRKTKSPLRQNVLRQNANTAAASGGMSTPSQPLHTPRRTKIPKNPFLPPDSEPRQWNGLVDLRQPSPSRSKAFHAKKDGGYDSDSSDDLFPPGMSPPVTMQFAMPSRVQRSAVKLALTPARKAAERIGRDLVANAVGRGTGADSARRALSSTQRLDPSLSSVAPSLPSLTRYSGHSTGRDKASVAEPLQVQMPGHIVTPAHQIYRPHFGLEAFALPSDSTHEESNSNARRLIVNEGTVPSPGSDSDSKSPEHNESNPSAAFIFATQNNARASADDSFGSSQQSESSDEEQSDAVRAARHPLAHIFAASENQGVGVDDSFEQDDSFAGGQGEEETVFGARQVGQGPVDGRLTIMRDALIDVTYPGAPSLNPFAQVEHTPTPHDGDGVKELR